MTFHIKLWLLGEGGVFKEFALKTPHLLFQYPQFKKYQKITVLKSLYKPNCSEILVLT